MLTIMDKPEPKLEGRYVNLLVIPKKETNNQIKEEFSLSFLPNSFILNKY